METPRLELLTVQANALATALVSIPDSNENARQRCLNFAAEVRGFVKAWSNLSKALHDPQLQPRVAFAKIVDRLLSDNSKIINDLRSQLAEVRSKQEAFDAAVRAKRWVPGRHKTAHLLVNFLGRETTHLRLLQVNYAISVLDVILGVVLHAKTLGEPTTQQDAQAAIRDQLTRLRAESEAKALVFREERRIGDKFVVSSLWLSTVTWHTDTAQQAPFETLALQWFEIVQVEEAQESASSPSKTRHNSGDTRRLAKLVMQLQQDMREQNHKHDEETDAHQKRHDNLRIWAEGNIRQLELSQQETARDAKEKIEGLTTQLEIQSKKIELDATTIEQLEYARKSWATHYQKQSEKLQHLEVEMKNLQNQTSQQQTRLDSLQQKYDRLLQQNQALRRRLEQSEIEKEELAEKFGRLQMKHSEVLKHNKQWKAYFDSTQNKDDQVETLRSEIEAARNEIETLKADLTDAQNSRDQLRDSLTEAVGQQDVSRQRSERYRDRLASPKKECPTSYRDHENQRDDASSRHQRRPSRSLRRSDGSSTTSRTGSRDGRSRASTSTYVGDDDSDREYYESRASKRSSSRGPSKLEAWFSPVQRSRAVA